MSILPFKIEELSKVLTVKVKVKLAAELSLCAVTPGYPATYCHYRVEQYENDPAVKQQVEMFLVPLRIAIAFATVVPDVDPIPRIDDPVEEFVYVLSKRTRGKAERYVDSLPILFASHEKTVQLESDAPEHSDVISLSGLWCCDSFPGGRPLKMISRQGPLYLVYLVATSAQILADLLREEFKLIEVDKRT